MPDRQSHISEDPEGFVAGAFTAFDPGLIQPRSSGERVNLMIHFHRAEIARMAGWRDRIDRTTNWSITVVAASLSFAFSSPSVSHTTMLACMVMVLFLLFIESRRYRFFDVFRCRVRTLERNYYAGLMSGTPPHDDLWLKRLGDDLRNPTFKLSLSDALKRRLRRNYLWLLLIILFAWALKVHSHVEMTVAGSVTDRYPVRFMGAAGFNFVPGSAVVGIVAALYLALLLYCSLPVRTADHLPRGGVNV